MSLCGTATSHCCWLGQGGQCPYVEPSPVEGFNWRCGLRAELGGWPSVYLDQRYIDDVKPWLIAMGYPTVDCGSWPPPGVTCNDCGEAG